MSQQPNYRVIDGKVVNLTETPNAGVSPQVGSGGVSAGQGASRGYVWAWVQLLRIDKPIGYLLLLWPTLAGLVLAARGLPAPDLLAIFCAGVLLTRSAGCVINDYADRWLDARVARTVNRPLAREAISARAALIAFVVLMLLAFGLVLLLPSACRLWAVLAGVLASVYPYCKRITHAPQLVLGVAFSMGIPMAFAAHGREADAAAWLLFIGNIAWTVGYDTLYAMIDREDDLRAGAKSTAILFGELDLIAVSICMAMAALSWLMLGTRAALGGAYFVGLLASCAVWILSVWRARSRTGEDCFAAFKLNHYAGLLLLVGMLAAFARSGDVV